MLSVVTVTFHTFKIYRMNYLEYKNLQQKTLESGNIEAICYLFDVGGKLMTSRLDSYKYKHSDLNDSETKTLYKKLGLYKDDVLIGGEIHRVVGDVETKKLFLRKVDEVDLFYVMQQIQIIKNDYVRISS